MTPEEEHHEEVIASSEGHTEEEKKQVPHNNNDDNKKKENVNEIVLNIDELIQCQAGSSKRSMTLEVEAKSETSNSVSCKKSDADHNNDASCSADNNKKVLKGVDLEGEEEEEERVCRICQLNEEQSVAVGVRLEDGAGSSSGLIKLGCGCKDELGLAHTVCAEAWFRLKGNRFCEICGETAKNISGDWDDRFIEKMWNERLSEGGGGSSSSQRQRGGCWRGQPFCNFLMACLVIAFVLPWFFRVKMF